MEMKEVFKIVQGLQELSTDTYMQFKYTMLAVSRAHQTYDYDFAKDLFSLADKHRPLLIGMKEGGVS